MKAVIVIDIPETIRTKYLNKDLIVQLWDKDDEHYIMHDICELKPMPQKIEGKREKFMPTYSLGWNDCLDAVELGLKPLWEKRNESSDC